MSLKHAILILLETEPGSGYDLVKRFKAGLGYFWNAKHQQVYQELKKLSEAGWLAFAEETQETRPDKKVYRLTQAIEREYLALPAAQRQGWRLPYLTLRRGILGEQAWLAWADEVALALKA